jgi:hypothetical protein
MITIEGDKIIITEQKQQVYDKQKILSEAENIECLISQIKETPLNDDFPDEVNDIVRLKNYEKEIEKSMLQSRLEELKERFSVLWE